MSFRFDYKDGAESQISMWLAPKARDCVHPGITAAIFSVANLTAE